MMLLDRKLWLGVPQALAPHTTLKWSMENRKGPEKVRAMIVLLFPSKLAGEIKFPICDPSPVFCSNDPHTIKIGCSSEEKSCGLKIRSLW